MLNKTILVVEDDPDLLDLLRELLQLQGYTVLNAGSGRDALQLWELNANNIDLLLTDLTLPDGISGVALAAELQGRKANLKVIYSSGYALDVAEQMYGLPEGFSFLQKPFQPEDLWNLVQHHLASSPSTN